MTLLDRRNFLRSALAGGAVGGFVALVERLDRFNAFGQAAFIDDASAFGPLVPTASANTGEILLALPSGFQYTVIGKSGSLMSNGVPTPILHDGMTVFQQRGSANWVVIRNHENANFAGSGGAVTGTSPYDANAAGGTTTLIVNKQSRLVTESYTSLTGTVRNCGGGRTPWNSWITCEETTLGPLSGFAKNHGYCFEVSPRIKAINRSRLKPVALKQMGRFRHEAVAVDPVTGIAYMTEDNPPASGFYRFVPNSPGNLAAGGLLQMLAVTNQPNLDLRTGRTVGQQLPVSWVNIADPDTVTAETNAAAVYNQGFALGAAIFSRPEGCYFSQGAAYFTVTNGGNAGFGQVWKYEPHATGTSYLTLIFESPSQAVLDMPDNICFGPNNGLYICEDGTGDSFMRVLSPGGSLSDLAKNIVPGFETYEFTGCTFSPDLNTLFVNIQASGMTFAIWGNWQAASLSERYNPRGRVR